MKQLSSPLLLAVLALMGVGLVQVYSSSYIFATESFENGLFFFYRQLLFVALSFVVLLSVSAIPFEWIQKHGWLLWLGAGIAAAAALIPGVGVRVGGAARWIQGPMGFRFEPSEILKFSVGILFATILIKNQTSMRFVKWWGLAIVILAPLVVLLKQPDFGSFAIISVVGLSLLFAFGLKWRYIIGSLAVMVPAFYFLVMQVPYRKARVLAFLDPWADPDQKGFQVIQSMLSFHSGGLTGAGLGQGQGKLFFLPEAHTDFTMAVMGEEIGFIGVLAVFALYAFVILRGFQIALRSETAFQRATALGITMTFALSFFINVGVVLGLLPTKGLTLPFLSYGGSSLLTLALMFGILINIEKHIAEGPSNPFVRNRNSVR